MLADAEAAAAAVGRGSVCAGIAVYIYYVKIAESEAGVVDGGAAGAPPLAAEVPQLLKSCNFGELECT